MVEYGTYITSTECADMNRIRRCIVWDNDSTIKQTIYKIDKNKAQKRSIGRYTVRKGYKIRGQQDSPDSRMDKKWNVNLHSTAIGFINRIYAKCIGSPICKTSYMALSKRASIMGQARTPKYVKINSITLCYRSVNNGWWRLWNITPLDRPTRSENISSLYVDAYSKQPVRVTTGYKR